MKTIEDFTSSNAKGNTLSKATYIDRSMVSDSDWQTINSSSMNGEVLYDRYSKPMFVLVKEYGTLALNEKFKGKMHLTHKGKPLDYARQNFESPIDIRIQDGNESYILEGVERITVLPERVTVFRKKID